jgi:DNA (cytosine-5)-methyltransferase 1
MVFMYNLTLGSLFDGSGGFPLAGMISGINPKWASEIEPFPIRVTTKRIPQMKHLGDITKIDGSKIEPVDIVTFGSPCQNLSLAGNRSGLDGEKSSLFYEAIRVIKEMRNATNGKYPRFIVWENVPGAYSSAGGNDFRCVLEEIIKIKDETYTVPMPERPNGSIKWMHSGEIVANDISIAWRTIDAQFWGVAQRRRRIYLITDFASECAGKILFESEGLFGNSTPCGITGQGITGNATACIGKTISFEPGAIARLETGHFWEDSTCTIRASMGDNRLAVAIENHPTDSRIKLDESGRVQTLTSRMGTGGCNVPLVMGERLQGLPITENIAQTILATDYKGAQCVCEVEPKTLKIRSGSAGGGKGALVQDNKSATLSCNNEQTVFVPKAYGICSDGSNSMKSPNPNSGIYEADTSRTIDGNACNPSACQGGIAIVESNEAYSFDPYNNKQDNVMPSIGTNCGMSTGRSICLQGSMIGRKIENGPNGDGINEDVSFCLNCTDRLS